MKSQLLKYDVGLFIFSATILLCYQNSILPKRTRFPIGRHSAETRATTIHLTKNDSDISLGLSYSKSFEDIANSLGPLCESGQFILGAVRDAVCAGVILLVAYKFMKLSR